MECPKCGHQQADTVKCESCGIYFAKFQQQRELIAARSSPDARTAPTGFGAGAIIVTALVTAAATAQ